jgi:hypothetical protein
MVRLLGWRIGFSQYLYLHQTTKKREVRREISVFRVAFEPEIYISEAVEDMMQLRPRGPCDRDMRKLIFYLSVMCSL